MNVAPPPDVFTLRLLPTDAEEKSEVLLSKQLLHTPGKGAYLITEMHHQHGFSYVEPKSSQGAKKQTVHCAQCFRMPFCKPWSDALVSKICKHLPGRQDVFCDKTKGTVAHLEVYYFLDPSEVGTFLPYSEIRQKMKVEDYYAVDFWVNIDDARWPPPPAQDTPFGLGKRHHMLLKIWLTQIPVAGKPHINKLIERAQKHLEQVKLDKEYHLVMLSDNGTQARNFEMWATSQRILCDAEGPLCEGLLVDKKEHVLSLKLAGETPMLINEVDNSRVERLDEETEGCRWDPWAEELKTLVGKEGTKQDIERIRKRVEFAVGFNKNGAIGPPDLRRCAGASEAISKLRNYYQYAQKPDPGPAFEAFATYFAEADRVKKLQLLWFAVIVPETHIEVEDWLFLRLHVSWVGQSYDYLLWAVARFWGVVKRNNTKRGPMYVKRHDEIRLEVMLGKLRGMRGGRINDKRDEFLDDLVKEELWLGLDRAHSARCRKSKNAQPHLLWNYYSTDDPCGNWWLSLEMLRRNVQKCDDIIGNALKSGKLREGAHLIVAGPQSCRLWKLLRHRDKFTVLELGQRDAPFAGPNCKLASLAVVRRTVHQLGPIQKNVLSSLAAGNTHLKHCACVHKCLETTGLWEAKDLAYVSLPPNGKDWIAQNMQLYGAHPVPFDADVQQIASYLCQLEEREARHREAVAALQLPGLTAAALEDAWHRRYALVLRQAGAAGQLGVSERKAAFLECFVEQLSRASEQPLLWMFAQSKEWADACKGHKKRYYYSQEIKWLVDSLITLCGTPASTILLIRWLLPAGLAHVGPEAKCWLARREDNRPGKRTLERPGCELLPGELAFLLDVAPRNRILWHSEWARRGERARGYIALLRRRALVAWHLRNAPPETARFALSPKGRFPAGRLSAGRQHWTQAHVLAYQCAGKHPDLSKPPELPPMEEPTAPDSPDWGASLADYLAAWEEQNELSESIYLVRHFSELYMPLKFRQKNPGTNPSPEYTPVQAPAGAYTAMDHLKLLDADGHVNDKAFINVYYLAGAVCALSEERRDLAAMLDAAEAYCLSAAAFPTHYRDELSAALALVRKKVVRHMARNEEEERLHDQNRQRQIAGFCLLQRDIFFDRARGRAGVLEGFGHRIKGESSDIKYWILDGERLVPDEDTRRALHADALAEAWLGSWQIGAGLMGLQEHARADAALAQEVLVWPTPEEDPTCEKRGLFVENTNNIKRARLHWRPDLSQLGRPEPTAVEALRPKRDGEGLPDLLGAHEITGPILRRLVGPKNVPHVAKMACVLRDPIPLNGQRMPSHLALTQCRNHKIALEPLTHSTECWPFFLKRLREEDFADNGSLLRGLRRAGAPVPVAARVAASHYLLPTEDYSKPASPALLDAMREERQLKRHKPLPPAQIWLEGEKEDTEVETADQRLLDFEKLGEKKWFKKEKLRKYWSLENRTKNWANHQKIKAPRRTLARPCRVRVRRHWVKQKGLPMTPWDDAGIPPTVFSCGMTKPVVICPRTSGREIHGGLPFGHYTRKKYLKHVGSLGQCILFGQTQQSLLRILRGRGIEFLAVNLDHTTVLKRFMVLASVAYLLATPGSGWRHFPLFLGDGKCSFPWLGGTKWVQGLQNLQQLVRKDLREKLQTPELAALRAQHPRLTFSAMQEQGLVVPKEALRIETLQRNALAIYAKNNNVDLQGTLEELSHTLDNQASPEYPALLLFPTHQLIHQSCSTDLSIGGRLVPKQLSKWFNDKKILDVIELDNWPAIAGDDPRPPLCFKPRAVPLPIQMGENVLVVPNLPAVYVRGLSERIGRGPRDADETWTCAALELQPPPEHPLLDIWQQLRELQEERLRENCTPRIGSREVVSLFFSLLNVSRNRIRGTARPERVELLEDATKGKRIGELIACELPNTPDAPSKVTVRSLLELYPRYFEVFVLHDIRQDRGFLGATECLTEAQLRTKKKKLKEGYNLDGAQYLLGCIALPQGEVPCTLEEARIKERHRLCHDWDGVEAELDAEYAQQDLRTKRELEMQRWPNDNVAIPGIAGSRLPAEPVSPTFPYVVFIAGKAAEFETAPYLSNWPCAALFPPEVKCPCYELQVESALQLLGEIFVQATAVQRDRIVLLVGVGTGNIIEHLPGLRPLRRTAWPPVCGYAMLNQLLTKKELHTLTAKQGQVDAVREAWALLSAHLPSESLSD